MKTQVIGVRVTEGVYADIVQKAEKQGLSASALVKHVAEKLANGEIWIENGEVRSVYSEENAVNSSNDAVYEEEDTPFGVKVDRKFDVLRERDYPEEVIGMLKQEILNGIEGRVSMMPKRYDKRKLRDNDGC